jgi:hypothetical protein
MLHRKIKMAPQLNLLLGTQAMTLQIHLIIIKQLPARRLLLRRLNLLKNCLNHPNNLQTNHFKVLAMAIFLQFNPQQIEYCSTKLTQIPLTIISITFLLVKLQAKHLKGI